MAHLAFGGEGAVLDVQFFLTSLAIGAIAQMSGVQSLLSVLAVVVRAPARGADAHAPGAAEEDRRRARAYVGPVSAGGRTRCRRTTCDAEVLHSFPPP